MPAPPIASGAPSGKMEKAPRQKMEKAPYRLQSRADGGARIFRLFAKGAFRRRQYTRFFGAMYSISFDIV